MAYAKVCYQDIEVSYLPELDGGGMDFGQEYVWVIPARIGAVEHLFEFCAGPGFIGFSLLAHGLCRRLTLADINPAAVEACRATIRDDKLEDRVSVYRSDCLDDIPHSERWDLIVGNPPHWPSDEAKYAGDRRMWDPDLRIHRKFYGSVRPRLKPGGKILLQENGSATGVEHFREMIEGNGLRIEDVFKAKPLSLLRCLLEGRRFKYTRPSQYYYILVRAA